MKWSVEHRLSLGDGKAVASILGKVCFQILVPHSQKLW